MKRKLFVGFCLLVVLAVCGYAQNVVSQTYEPEFIGETNLLCISENDTVAMPLEKRSGKIKSKAGASVYLTGMGAVKTRIHIEGRTSTCVAKLGYRYNLIVKAADNNQDPNSFIQLVKFEVKKKERRCEIGKVSTFGGSSSGTEGQVEYKAKRYGESSYQLFFEPPVPGEYGVFMSNPNSRDEKRIIVYCFTVQ